jgi:hypothetical protein
MDVSSLRAQIWQRSVASQAQIATAPTKAISSPTNQNPSQRQLLGEERTQPERLEASLRDPERNFMQVGRHVANAAVQLSHRRNLERWQEHWYRAKSIIMLMRVLRTLLHWS